MRYKYDCRDGVHLLRELIQAQGESIFSGSTDGLYMESIIFQSELLRIKVIARRMHESDPSSHALVLGIPSTISFRCSELQMYPNNR